MFYHRRQAWLLVAEWFSPERLLELSGSLPGHARISKEGNLPMSDLLSYQRVCGIDISKETLDVRALAGDVDSGFTVGNNAAGFARIIELCLKHQIQIVVLEATGGLQRKLAVALVEAAISVAIINPSRIRYYALAEGLMAKTDKVDARLIAFFALKIAPRATALRTELQEELAGLSSRKSQLNKTRTAEENRRHRLLPWAAWRRSTRTAASTRASAISSAAAPGSAAYCTCVCSRRCATIPS